MTADYVKLVGVYEVVENPDVTLLELIIYKSANEFDLLDFTQEITGQAIDNWQVPFSEKYLDQDGKTIIGDEFDRSNTQRNFTRLTFFIYFLDPAQPLVTPFGEIKLIEKVSQPQRIREIIIFENPE